MAESLMSIDSLPIENDRPRHADDDDPSQLISVDADSGGDADDYSSGSDRSIGADDADLQLHDSISSSIGQADADAGARSRRKRRHGSHGSRRQKGGSRHKHKGFHPYPPQEEMKRKSLEIKEKENAAAEIRRDEGDQEFVKFPTAPFNSTQFLMDEHNVASPIALHKTPSSSKLEMFNNTPCTISAQTIPKHLETNTNVDKSNPKVNKEFTEIYTTLHAESLQSLPKDELVKHYMNLEEQVAVLQKKVAEQKKCETLKTDIDGDKDSVSDSASVCDTNSLSSSNEEYVDLAAVNQPTISVGDTDDHPTIQHRKDS